MKNFRSGRKKPPKKPKLNCNSVVGDIGINTFTAHELQSMEFPPLQFVVDEIIVEGATLLVGKPKVGKSWMALNIAMAVASGGKALGDIQCKKGPVLYAALEDNQRRLQRRMRQCYGAQNQWPKNFYFATELPRLDEGGLELLEDWTLDKKPALIIIDTLVCVKSKASQEGGYDADYNALAPLQQLAGELATSFVILHHQRKMDAQDPFDTISGSTGLTGAVDTALVLQGGKNGMTLYGRGREIEEFQKAVTMKHGANTNSQKRPVHRPG